MRYRRLKEPKPQIQNAVYERGWWVSKTARTTTFRKVSDDLGTFYVVATLFRKMTFKERDKAVRFFNSVNKP